MAIKNIPTWAALDAKAEAEGLWIFRTTAKTVDAYNALRRNHGVNMGTPERTWASVYASKGEVLNGEQLPPRDETPLVSFDVKGMDDNGADPVLRAALGAALDAIRALERAEDDG